MAKRVVLALSVSVASSLGVTFALECMTPRLASAAPSSCETGVPAVVNYVVSRDAARTFVVQSVKVSGVSGSCDGEPAVLDLYGNSAGDSTVPVADDDLLAQADSMLDPCSQQPLDAAGVLSGGTLTFSLCPTGGRAGDVSLHDLTAVSLNVAGTQVAIASQQTGGNRSERATTGATGDGTNYQGLAFTGAETASTVLAGLSILAAGTLVAVLSRRPRKRGTIRGPG